MLKKSAFLEKRGCGSERGYVNTPSPAALRRATGRQTGHTATRRKQTSQADKAGRARKLRRISVNFVSTLFEKRIELKRYVGGLVHPMDQPLHIALIGATRLLSVSFTV